MKKIAIAIVVLLVIAAAVFFNQQESVLSEDELTLYGNIDIREIHLSVNASEHIKDVYVEEGDRVTEGQLLAVLHTELLEAQLAEVQAMLKAQQQMVAKLKAGSRKEEIARAKAEHAAAKCEAKMASSVAFRTFPHLAHSQMTGISGLARIGAVTALADLRPRRLLTVQISKSLASGSPAARAF